MGKAKRENFNQISDRMMVDSGTTSAMTAFLKRVRAADSCDVTISLADD